MKKIFTTLCAIALTTVVAQAQNTLVDASAKKQEVKKEAAASVNQTDIDAANAPAVSESDRAKYEAYKKQQMDARKGKATKTSSNNNAGEVKTISNTAERKKMVSENNRLKLTPEQQQKEIEEKSKKNN